MKEITREKIIFNLNREWGSYVSSFKKLTLQEQADFLNRQGYLRFADLLSHLIAWWEGGISSIRRFQHDPAYQSPSVDVDAFNAAAVNAAKDKSEEQVIHLFEERRKQFVDFVNDLADEDFHNEKIVWQLNIELIGHYQEHKID